MKKWEQKKNYEKFLESLKTKSNKKQRDYIMSMELHTLRAVKVTKDIIAKTRYLSFELRRVNKEIEEVSRIMESLQRKKTRLENSF